MPSGTTHAIITTLTAASIAGIGYYTGQPNAVTVGTAGGCLAGLFLSPDLDVNDPTYSYGLVKKEAGPFMARLWYYAWFPYARLIRHRSWISHFPVLSTLIRVGYLSGIAWLILLLLGKPWPWTEVPAWLPWTVAGLILSDTLHWGADNLNTWFKRNTRRHRRRF